MKIYQVDAFTDRAFSGNPAAVCVLTEPMDEKWMQAVAQEMNVSETAFVLGTADGFSLRWFTPVTEVELCGHATLATAHVLWENGLLPRNTPARFQTLSGRLSASRRGNSVILDLPSRPVADAAPPPGLAETLGVVPLYVGRSDGDYLLEVSSEEEVRALRPDFARLRCVPVRGAIVTSRASSSDFDFVSRFFAPSVGVDEDPVTGSAHCRLGPFWSGRLGKSKLVAYQASRRGGVVKLHVGGDRIELAGQAVTVLSGDLLDAAWTGAC